MLTKLLWIPVKVVPLRKTGRRNSRVTLPHILIELLWIQVKVALSSKPTLVSLFAVSNKYRPTIHEARPFKNPFNSSGFKLKNLFQSKPCVITEMTQTVPVRGDPVDGKPLSSKAPLPPSPAAPDGKLKPPATDATNSDAIRNAAASEAIFEPGDSDTESDSQSFAGADASIMVHMPWKEGNDVAVKLLGLWTRVDGHGMSDGAMQWKYEKRREARHRARLRDSVRDRNYVVG